MIDKEPDKPARGGRPRGFDRDAALETAMRLFWRHGYEGTSIADLAGAIGIAAPSLYAAFASKAALYREALDRYAGLSSGIGVAALAGAPTIAAGVQRLLADAVDAMVSPDRERGCMVTTAFVADRPSNHAVAEDLRRRRGEMRDALAAAIGRHLPPARAEATARYLMALLQGLAIQARDGATRSELMGIVATADLRRPPPGPPSSV